MLLAHYDRESGQKQTLAEHLAVVKNLMQEDTAALSFANVSQEDWQRLLAQIGGLHDIGKVMPAYQQYLQSGNGGWEKNHALISAAILSEQFEPQDGLGFLAVLCVARHHQAMDTKAPNETSNNRQELCLSEQYASCSQALASFKAPVPVSLHDSFDLERWESFWRKWRSLARRQPSDQWFFVLQYLFSKLLAADKLDSAGLKKKPALAKADIASVAAYLHNKTKGQTAAINDNRQAICQSVIDKINSLSDAEIKSQRIFTLTAPTGTGKTLTSISAALTLARRLEKTAGYTPRLITAMPFINILEQTREDYEGIFPDVLVHYGAADQEANNQGDMPLKDRLLLTEAWESDVIITTFVQLFESVLSGQNRRVLKVNRLSGAIVILDEVQALPAEYYPLLGAVICRLSQYYGTRFIMMTATQPEIIAYANQLLPDKSMSAVELLPDGAAYYQSLRRTRLVPVMDQVKDNEALVSFLGRTRGQEEAALVVVNTIAQSIEVYRMLKAAGECKVLYLSTNLTPVDRRAVINLAKTYLHNRTPFILVSTQTVEAGVDLDFDIGYREMAPLEAIIQVVGRVNRSALKGEFRPLYVFDTGNAKQIYSFIACASSKKCLNREIRENEYYRLMRDYYLDLYTRGSNFKESEEVYEGILNLNYQKIQEFKLIKETERQSVLILRDEYVKGKTAELCSLIRTPKRDFETRAQIKRLHNIISAYMVDIYPQKLSKNRPIPFADLYGLDLPYYVVPQEELDRYYDETGFIAEDKGAYLY